jgi:hypothetical protein
LNGGGVGQNGSPGRPVGVRPAGDRWAPIRWADPGGLALDVGQRVMVRDGTGEWPAEVVVSADRIVEAPALEGLVLVIGPADDAAWPAAPAGAGLALLRSLNLPDPTPQVSS